MSKSELKQFAAQGAVVIVRCVVCDSPLTDALLLEINEGRVYADNGPMVNLCRELERDCMTLALRLYSEYDNTFAPVTREVMSRWRPRVEELLKGDGK
jgi:hypothetical protein